MSTQSTLHDHSGNDTNILGTTTAGDTITTQNIHATGTLNQDLALKPLHKDLESSEDYIDRHGFIRIDYNGIPGSIQLWRTGSYTITGINTPEDLTAMESQFLGELRRLGIDLTPATQASISNYIVTLELNTDTTRLNLDAIAIGLGLEHIEYEPEQFPGVLYRPEDTDGVCLIFGSGSILLTGMTTQDEIFTVAENLRAELTSLALF